MWLQAICPILGPRWLREKSMLRVSSLACPPVAVCCFCTASRPSGAVPMLTCSAVADCRLSPRKHEQICTAVVVEGICTLPCFSFLFQLCLKLTISSKTKLQQQRTSRAASWARFLGLAAVGSIKCIFTSSAAPRPMQHLPGRCCCYYAPINNACSHKLVEMLCKGFAAGPAIHQRCNVMMILAEAFAP